MIRTRDLDTLATANGPELGVLIDRVTECVDELSEAQMLELMKASVRLEGWATSRRATVIAAFAGSVEAEVKALSGELTAAQNKACDAAGKKRSASAASHDFDDAKLIGRQVGTEIALKLGISTRTADREINLALELRRWPIVKQALAEGRIDKARAALICEEVRALHDPVNHPALFVAVGHRGARLTWGRREQAPLQRR